MIRFRPATPADADLLRRWDEQPHVMAAIPNVERAWDRELARSPEWREYLIGEEDGRPVGFVEILDPARDDERYWGESPPGLRAIDVWIGEAADLGRGLGTEMLGLALARCVADPAVEAVLLDPLATNVRARRLYERLGFVHEEDRWFGPDHCAVYRLDRARWAARGGGAQRG
jgi:aminoglycoside 6'-N-acetyltransferase